MLGEDANDDLKAKGWRRAMDVILGSSVCLIADLDILARHWELI
jgi:hypothetical protein